MRSVMLFLMLATVAACSACGGGVTAADPPAGVRPEALPAVVPGLPAPNEIPHSTRTLGVDEICMGANCLPGACGNFNPNSTRGVYNADWRPDEGSFELAFAVYEFSVTPADGFARIDLDWETIPAECYIGLSDYLTNSWEWFPTDSGSLTLPADLTAYLDSEFMLVAVVVTGTGMHSLNELTLAANGSGGHGLDNLFFLHHSTGAGIVFEGDVRGHVAQYNADHATGFAFWDHGYAGDGLYGPDGVQRPPVEWYGPMTDYTDPPDLHNLWTSSETEWEALRFSIIENHEVIAFKSCFPASGIYDNNLLDDYKDWYSDMLDFFDTRPDRLFVVMSPPPLNPAATNDEDAGRARQFADWLKSAAYLDGHPNVVCFDLFNELAEPDDGTADANMLRGFYRNGDDSHPNSLGYNAVAPVFANFLCSSAAGY